ncbi:hypothetical protein M406DRAFT_106993 [Cryphonectria parasitica EP155]|uniref:Uncharacterized protein n=1 Tax=Cryphonectria parasitica (strain ATCC 38755 / EP155) TaxID=660469 RepID=A0A9P4Y150_CRYP1|nr:uncharacterized protein M406DRAFT_106993 [Cryphonectria parasitica EP155]KAF3765069.1 hypothetical protein M406DRAFT_106993 [Cryphonectria parasitica EP155]
MLIEPPPPPSSGLLVSTCGYQHQPASSHTYAPPIMKPLGMEDPASYYDPLFGDSYADPLFDAEPLRRDPEAESVRSHPSSISHAADQTLLPHRMPSLSSRPQTQRLQRRRSRYLYVNGVLVPVTSASMSSPLAHPQSSDHGASWTAAAATTTAAATTASSPPSSSPPPPPTLRATVPHRTLSHKRIKSYGVSGTTSSWLLGSGGNSNGGVFADAKRQAWTGERREVRKLQKDHPVGSARPAFTIAIGSSGDGGADEVVGAGAGAGAGDKDGLKGSVLGMRRKMERLKGLYRRGSKEAVMGSTNSR